MHRSDITEALAVSVRYCFHRLLRSKAYAAAVRFYWRLADLGVSLKNSDIAFLLANLPYDKSASSGSEAEIAAWVDEQSHKKVSWKEQKVAEQQTENQNTSSNTQQQQQRQCDPANSEITPSRAAGASPGWSRWVTRWALYEASMGHLDVETVQQQCTQSAGAATPSHVSSDNVSALIQHLLFLQSSLHSRSTSKLGGDGRRSPRDMYTGFWAEALNLVANTTFSTSVDDASRVTLSTGMAQAALAAMVWQQRLAGHNSRSSRRSCSKPAVQLLRMTRLNESMEAGASLLACVTLCREVLCVRHLQPTSQLARNVRLAAARLQIATKAASPTSDAFADVSLAAAPPLNTPVAAAACIESLIMHKSLAYEVVHASQEDVASKVAFVTDSLQVCVDGFFDHVANEQQLRKLVLIGEAPHAAGATQSTPFALVDESAAHRRVLRLETELTLELLVGAVQSFVSCVIPVRRELHALNDLCHVADVVRQVVLGQRGLLRFWLTMYDVREHEHVRDFKAAINAPEKSRVSLLVCGAITACAGALCDRRHKRCSTSHDALTHLLSAVRCVARATANADRDQLRTSKRLTSILRFALAVAERCYAPLADTRRQAVSQPLGQNPLAVGLLSEVVRVVLLVYPGGRHARPSARLVSPLLRLCAPQSPAARPLRDLLSAVEVKSMEGWITSFRVPGRWRRGSTSSRQHDKTPKSLAAIRLSDVQVLALKRAKQMTPEEIAEVERKRKGVALAYELSSHSIDSSAIEAILASQQSWDDALCLVDGILRSVKLRGVSLPTRAFVSVLDRLYEARTRAARKNGSADLTSSPHTESASHRRSLWQQAASVFWLAVDHNLERLALSSASREHNVLRTMDHFIPVLLKLCMADSCRETGRRWNEAWQRLHAQLSDSATLGSEAFLIQKLQHASILRERDVLSRLLYFHGVNEVAGIPSLALREAVGSLIVPSVVSECQQGRWLEAFRLLVKQCPLDSPRPNSLQGPAALAMLTCLNAPREVAMSKSALSIFSHCRAEAWTAEHSHIVLQLLCRGRKWKAALEFFSTPCLVPYPHTAHKELLLEGLRACAIGGQPDIATVLYDAYTGLGKVSEYQSAPSTSTTRIATADRTSIAHRDVPRGHDEASLAKMLFFRSMTKSMAKGLAPHGDSSASGLLG